MIFLESLKEEILELYEILIDNGVTFYYGSESIQTGDVTRFNILENNPSTPRYEADNICMNTVLYAKLNIVVVTVENIPIPDVFKMLFPLLLLLNIFLVDIYYHQFWFIINSRNNSI